jgi:hypothetical protein
LDTTGRHIDPSTGEAFLTVNLADLGGLITRPSGDQKWTTAPGNSAFVTFLNSKKKYLEPAMENCQDISDRVWNAFIEDALAQIKLAQEQKLEDIRQGCTSLTTQCLATTAKSVSEFDARALSIFGVHADKTVNEMCSGIKNACAALLQTTGGTDNNWEAGMTGIETDKTYEAIMQTCTEVGKACIIQTCKAISGNFGLCENVDTSVNRKSIINRTACWNEVLDCVGKAGEDSINRIMISLGKIDQDGTVGNFYTELYGENIQLSSCSPINSSTSSLFKFNDNCVYDICKAIDDCATTDNSFKCKKCRLAEKIWGNCELKETQPLDDPKSENEIKKPNNVDTLLSWFSKNTGTSDKLDSCKDTTCPRGQTQNDNGVCFDSTQFDSLNNYCGQNAKVTITDGFTNCCTNYGTTTSPGDNQDFLNNCCELAARNPVISNYNQADISNSIKICPPNNNVSLNLVASYNDKILVCMGSTSYKDDNEDNIADDINIGNGFPTGQTIKCYGTYVSIDISTGTYDSPEYTLSTDGSDYDDDDNPTFYSQNYYKYDRDNSKSCVYNQKSENWRSFTDNSWSEDTTNCNKINDALINSDNNLIIKYESSP